MFGHHSKRLHVYICPILIHCFLSFQLFLKISNVKNINRFSIHSIVLVTGVILSVGPFFNLQLFSEREWKKKHYIFDQTHFELYLLELSKKTFINLKNWYYNFLLWTFEIWKIIWVLHTETYVVKVNWTSNGNKSSMIKHYFKTYNIIFNHLYRLLSFAQPKYQQIFNKYVSSMYLIISNNFHYLLSTNRTIIFYKNHCLITTFGTSINLLFHF